MPPGPCSTPTPPLRPTSRSQFGARNKGLLWEEGAAGRDVCWCLAGGP